MLDPIRVPADFDALPLEEQIDFVQALWDHIAENAARAPMPEWHVEELREREAAYRAAPDEISTWEDVRERILRRNDRGSRARLSSSRQQRRLI